MPSTPFPPRPSADETIVQRIKEPMISPRLPTPLSTLVEVDVVGRFQGIMNLGVGSATSNGAYDAFFAKLAP